MEKKLNIDTLKKSATQLGYSQTAIAKQLGLTKAAVSKWFKNSSFPRPAELLKLGRLMKLDYDELVQTSNDNEPLVAFRKRGSCITKDEHFIKAKNMGRFLTPLVKYLEFDKFVGPASLKKPSTDYAYLQELVSQMRRDMDISESAVINFSDIVDCFHKYQAVIIPTLWGEKAKHENALHIHLPESKTTWIYLNLDSKIHDFKYWMAHEFGHVITIDLLASGDIDAAEDFAEAFAGALLFPKAAATRAYASYKRARTDKTRINVLLEYAEEYLISPLSVYLETQNYANALNSEFTKLDQKELHIRISQFNKQFKTLSAALFDGAKPKADHFMRVAQENFGTDFYKALGSYLRDHEAPPQSIASIMSISRVDATAYHEALVSNK